MCYPKSLTKLIDEFKGKSIFCCRFFSGMHINFDSHGILLCHKNELENRPSDVTNTLDYCDFSAESFYEKIYEIITKAQDPGYPCRSCSQCKEGFFDFRPVGFVVTGTSLRCNSSCIYCYSRSNSDGSYDTTPLIQEFHENGLLHEECFFDWGGGEPTLNPTFEKTADYIAGKGYAQRINTNAIIFSEQTFRVLKAGIGTVRVSVDAGTKECFKKVKGHDNYEAVWKNIARYCETSDNVFVKYNIFNMNSDCEELDAFLDQCRDACVKNIAIDAEHSSYMSSKNAGPFYFRNEEFEAVHYLSKQAFSMGFSVSASPALSMSVMFGNTYAMENHPFLPDPRGVRGGVGELPKTYYDNTDYEIISNGVYARTFATVGHLLERINSESELPVYIFGNDDDGKLAFDVLKREGFIPHIIDNSPKPGDDVIHAKKIMKEQPRAHIVLSSSKHWKEMLKQINDCKYDINGYVYYMPPFLFRKHINDEGSLSR